ncbi:Mutator MutT protein [Legionella beliardensis]|uniref:Mutator MutT protein n=1 Tax=Legionella beliardensis TaxID=91822 RepID=A0A378I281_9GAMM|nr:NUDIX hydrolase [Legionella beliardensis]STX29103.1 Mutator MutT protein [Legionella beliardensis]
MKEAVLNTKNLLSIANEIQAIAQIGLAYCKDQYDRERYKQLMAVSAKLFNIKSEEALELKVKFLAERGYASPKIDVRAFIRKDDELLLVQERQDGKWALPGGWADVNLSPSECIVKEVKEETGLICRAVKLVALWDTARHDHPPHWPYTYKCIFQCEILGGKFESDHEIMDISFFPLNNLPPLSLSRITKKQINELIKLVDSEVGYTVFD